MRIPIPLLALVLLPAGLAGQNPRSPATPRPAHERLAVFEGTWRKAEPSADGSFLEVCTWLEGGRRHMICRPRYENAGGAVEHRTIYSYRGSDSTYIVTALLAPGQVWTYHGRPEGNRWVFDLQGRDPARRLRMIVTVAADTVHFVEEASENGAPWRVTEDYRHVRVRQDAP